MSILILIGVFVAGFVIGAVVAIYLAFKDGIGF